MYAEMEDNIFVEYVRPLCLKSSDSRKVTDILFIVIFLIDFLFWLKECHNEIQSFDWSSGIQFYVSFEKFIFSSVTYGLVAAVVIFYFILCHSNSKCRVPAYLATFLVAIQIFGLLVLTPWQLFIMFKSYESLFPTSFLVVTFTVTIMCLIYQATTYICLRETEINVLSEIIAKSCRAASHSFLAVIFCLMTIFAALIVFVLTIKISYDMSRSYQYSTNEVADLLNGINVFVFAFGGLYIFNFIINFGFLVMSDYFANYYGIFDKATISKMHVFRSLMMVLRYHLGTIAFLSTPMLPRICALVMSFRYSRQSNKKSDDMSINFASKISLTMDITDFSLVQTSMYGVNAFKSMRNMFDLHQYSLTLFLTLNTVTLKFIEFNMLITAIVTMITAAFVNLIYFLFAIQFNYPIHGLLNEYGLIMAAFFIILIHKILIRPAMSTFLIYKMTSIQMSDISEKIHFIESLGYMKTVYQCD